MTSYHDYDPSDIAFELEFQRPSELPRGLAIIYLLFCHTPLVPLMGALNKRNMKYEMLIAFGVFSFSVTQVIHEIHDKAKCWDDIHLCGGIHTFTREDGSYGHSFDWTALANTNWLSIDFFQWERLCGVASTILVCLLLIDAMQNKRRENDRACCALFTAGILLISEWCKVNDVGLVQMTIIPVTVACLMAAGRIIQHLFAKRYAAERLELAATVVSFFVALLFFLLQNNDEDRKSSLARPCYGLFIFFAGASGYFCVQTFRNKSAQGKSPLPPPTATECLEPSTKSWAPQLADEENPESKAAEAAKGTKKPKWAPECHEGTPKEGEGEEEHETKEKQSSKEKGKGSSAKSRSMARSPG